MASLAIAVTPTTGTGQDLDFLVSPGPLHRAHSELTGLKNCSTCHSSESGLNPAACIACHKDLAERVSAQKGFHAGKQDRCFECHHEHQGEDFALVDWNPTLFNHDETGYPLVGMHRRVETCEDCHRPGNSPSRRKTKTYFLNDVECIACHEDVHKNQLGQDCERCHSLLVGFRDVRFGHEGTAFPLVGAHQRVDCVACHRGKQWKGIRHSTCTDCHNDPHLARLGENCERCHDESSWLVASFDHDGTRYPLRGMHRPLECSRCHATKQFTGIAFGGCVDCHSKDPHLGQFADDCSRCHVVEGFDRTTFEHSQASYPLTGKHMGVQCSDCHRLETADFPGGMAEAVRYKPLKTSCVSCHEDFHLGQFAKGCDNCHTTQGFSRTWVRFEHNDDSRFPLAGKHLEVTCGDCHKPEHFVSPEGERTTIRYRPLPDECIDCHGNVHDKIWWTSSRNSVRSDCRECHSVDTFFVDKFDHNRTEFPLTGKHAALRCGHCHDSVRRKDRQFILFQKTAQDCAGCHRSPHLKGLERCTNCHTTTSWRVRAW